MSETMADDKAGTVPVLSVLDGEREKAVELGGHAYVMREPKAGKARRLMKRLAEMEGEQKKLAEAKDEAGTMDIVHEMMEVAIRGACSTADANWDAILEEADMEEVCLAFDAAKSVILGPLLRMAKRGRDQMKLAMVATPKA